MELKINFGDDRNDNVAGRIHSASSKWAHFQVELSYRGVKSTNHTSDSMLQVSIAFCAWFCANVSSFYASAGGKIDDYKHSIIRLYIFCSKP